MEYRTLGSSGCAVSTLALGTMTFGARPTRRPRTTSSTRFVEAGGTLVDTADVYAGGASEEIIGRWLGDRPPTSATGSCSPPRAGSRWATGRNDVGLSRRHLRGALDASLRRLGVDRVDLYQVHAWDPLTPLEETLRFLDDAVRAGKIRYVGLSNYTGWQMQKAVDLADARAAWPRPVTLQPQYNLLVREIEWEIVPACAADGPGPAAVVAARRRLADRQVHGGTSGRPAPPGSARTRTAAWRPTTGAAPSSAPGTSSTPSRRSPTAAASSMAQVALAWLLDRPARDLGDPRRPHASSSSTTTSAPPACTSPPRRRRGWTPPATPAPPTTRTAGRASSSAAGKL